MRVTGLGGAVTDVSMAVNVVAGAVGLSLLLLQLVVILLLLLLPLPDAVT